jgi:DNA-binding CsgD family transcriptional regulator
MTADLQLQPILDAMSESSSQEDLWNKLFSYMNFCDIDALVYHHLPPPGALDYKEDLVVEKQFKRPEDELVEFINHIFDANLRKGARVLDHAKYWSYSATAAKDTMIENGAENSLNLSGQINAVTFPVHGPGGRNGCFSLVYSETDEVRVEQKVRILQWACQNAHQLFCKLYLSNVKAIPKLTEREAEILSWVARGKSNSVIAQILGISPHTVNTYMRRLFLKLGTSDRTSVSLIGISNGLIEI